ncbi:hypothetical protein GLOIN_2v1763167 [Rhizophagus irregularis DAOM 181602=DAOM 197198]|nr:hypothetical protein GLOIN_2v1763167 [Rhizophagus irregularis DAOM 181602=DAOM 197198]
METSYSYDFPAFHNYIEREGTSLDEVNNTHSPTSLRIGLEFESWNNVDMELIHCTQQIEFVWIKIRKVISKDRTTSVSFACDRSGIYKPKKVADILNREIKGAKSATIQIGSHQLKETFDEVQFYTIVANIDAAKIISLKQDDDPLWFIDSFTANNNLTRIMWMTPKQINLLLYSDVIICDTTFGANKYDMSLMLGFGCFKLNGDLLNKHDVARQYLTDNLYPMHTTWEKRYINHVLMLEFKQHSNLCNLSNDLLESSNDDHKCIDLKKNIGFSNILEIWHVTYGIREGD